MDTLQDNDTLFVQGIETPFLCKAIKGGGTPGGGVGGEKTATVPMQEAMGPVLADAGAPSLGMGSIFGRDHVSNSGQHVAPNTLSSNLLEPTVVGSTCCHGWRFRFKSEHSK